jgi:hypothetical protein
MLTDCTVALSYARMGVGLSCSSRKDCPNEYGKCIPLHFLPAPNIYLACYIFLLGGMATRTGRFLI